MIELEVFSPNQDEQGLYRYFYNEVVIGPRLGHDLILPFRRDCKFFLKVQGEDLWLTLPENYKVLVEGRRVSGTARLKKEDLFEDGDFQFKILDFQETSPPEEQKFPYREYEKLMAQKDPKAEFLMEIEKRIESLRGEIKTFDIL